MLTDTRSNRKIYWQSNCPIGAVQSQVSVEQPSERASSAEMADPSSRPSRRHSPPQYAVTALESERANVQMERSGGRDEGGQMRTSLSMKYGAKRRELCRGSRRRRRRRRRRCSCRHTLSPTIPRTKEKLERGIPTGYSGAN